MWWNVAPHKRFTLLLEEGTRPSFTMEFRKDCHYDDVCEHLVGKTQWYSTTFGKRSVFKRMNVLQVKLCFTKVGWNWTPRTATRETS